MVDPYQVTLAAIAVAVMIVVPIVCVVLYDLAAGRWDAQIGRWRDSRSDSVEHRRNVRALRRVQGIPIEQVAANLRRLRCVLANDEHRSAAHQIGSRLAYDKVLMQACQMLDLSHDLQRESAGLERDIERLRVEAELEGAGVVISTDRYGQAA
jgi:hypothetical protein